MSFRVFLGKKGLFCYYLSNFMYIEGKRDNFLSEVALNTTKVLKYLLRKGTFIPGSVSSEPCMATKQKFFWRVPET